MGEMAFIGSQFVIKIMSPEIYSRKITILDYLLNIRTVPIIPFIIIPFLEIFGETHVMKGPIPLLGMEMIGMIMNFSWEIWHKIGMMMDSMIVHI